jgi:hypothetical protein
MMRKRYITDGVNAGFINETIIDKQIKASSSDLARTLMSTYSFLSGLAPINSTGPQLSERQLNTLRSGRMRSGIKINRNLIDKLGNAMGLDALPKRYHPIFIWTLTDSSIDKVNMFTCDFIKE